MVRTLDLGILCLKPLGDSKIDSGFLPSDVDQMRTETPGDLVVKNKVSCSGSVSS